MSQMDTLVAGFDDLEVFDYHIVAEDPCDTLLNICQATVSHCDVECALQVSPLCTGFCKTEPGTPTVGRCKCKKL